MDESQRDFLTLLGGLMSLDNSFRKQAEEAYQAHMNANPNAIINQLMITISSPSVDQVLRIFSAVLMRRGVEQQASKIPPVIIEELRTKLLHYWLQEKNILLCNKVAHVLAEFSIQNPWPNLINIILTSQLSQVSVLATLSLLEILADYSPEDVTEHFQLLGTFLGEYLQFNDAKIKLAAAKATSACVAAMVNDDARMAFQPSVLPILAILGQLLAQGDELEASSLIEHLITIAQFQPTFFKPTFDQLIAASLMIGNHADLEFSTRAAALELLVTICESAPAMARRAAGFLENLISMTMTLMLEVDEDEEGWKRGKYGDDFEEDALDADDALQRIAAGLGGKSICDITLALVERFSQSGEWKYRRAAVASLSHLSEGCSKQFGKFLPAIKPYILASLTDNSARVQYEAIQCAGRLASIYPESCASLIEDYLAPLAMSLQNPANCDRVRGHAASALIDLLTPENCESNVLTKFVDPLVQSLAPTLGSARNEVRAPCLVLLGRIAKICPESFAPYYVTFMPGVKDILLNATSNEFRELRGKAMECAGLIGEAVGVQQFAADALEIMRIFVAVMAGDADNDITFDYVLPACASMAKALGASFHEFLPFVFNTLLTGANKEVQFSMEQAEADEEEGEVVDDEDNGTQSTVVKIGAGVKMRVTLNTHAVQQKSQAAKLIFEFANSLGKNLGGLILPSMEASINLLGDKHSNEIRANAALALAKLFEALIDCIKEGRINPTEMKLDLAQILKTSVDGLAESLKREPDSEARNCEAESLRDILQAIFESGQEEPDGSRRGGFILALSDEITMHIVGCALLQSADCLLRRTESEEALKNTETLDDEDREAQGEETEKEDDLLGVFVDVIGHLIKLRGESFMPTFDRAIAPSFSSYLSNEQPESLQAVACCLIDDAIEYGGESAVKYIPNILPALLMNTQVEDTILRQCSMYGLGVACKLFPATMLQYVPPLLSCFVSTILRPDADHDDNKGVTENAVFGLGSLLTNPLYREQVNQQNPTFPITELSKLWIKRLPLKLDPMECKTTISQLCDAFERNDELVLGQNGLLLPDVLRIFGEVAFASRQDPSAEGLALSPHLTHPVTVQRIKQLIVQSQSIPGHVGQRIPGVFASIAPHLQSALTS